MEKSYYAVIPANVRYDKNISPNAKLLYGEITALCNEKGYCWASNSYFAELYKVSKETVSRWISKLEELGYIRTELIYEQGTKSVKERRIYIYDAPIDKNINTPCEKNQYPIDKKINTPIDKNVKENNTLINNTINNTSINTFDQFWFAYPKKRSKGQAEKAWNKIKPDNELFATIMRSLEKAKASREWIKDNGQFIPYPATWLNAKGWEDEYTPAKKVDKQFTHEHSRNDLEEAIRKKTLASYNQLM